jgi:hypothetical protein
MHPSASAKSFEQPCDDGELLSLEQPALASCYQAATAGRQLFSEHPDAPARPAQRLSASQATRSTRGGEVSCDPAGHQRSASVVEMHAPESLLEDGAVHERVPNRLLRVTQVLVAPGNILREQ